MADEREVRVPIAPEHAEAVLERFYQARYDDHEKAAMVVKTDVQAGIEELEQKFPEFAKEFNDD